MRESSDGRLPQLWTSVLRRSTICWVREIRWTEDSEAHIARHKVDPADVEQAVFSRPRLVDSGSGGTRVVFGTTDAGRYLVVVLSDAEDGRLFEGQKT